MVRITDHAPPQYVTFSSLQFQMSVSAPYSWTPSAYVLRLKLETSFHTVARQQAKLDFCIFWRLLAKWLRSVGCLLGLFTSTVEYCYKQAKTTPFLKRPYWHFTSFFLFISVETGPWNNLRIDNLPLQDRFCYCSGCVSQSLRHSKPEELAQCSTKAPSRPRTPPPLFFWNL